MNDIRRDDSEQVFRNFLGLAEIVSLILERRPEEEIIQTQPLTDNPGSFNLAGHQDNASPGTGSSGRRVAPAAFLS